MSSPLQRATLFALAFTTPNLSSSFQDRELKQPQSSEILETKKAKLEILLSEFASQVAKNLHARAAKEDLPKLEAHRKERTYWLGYPVVYEVVQTIDSKFYKERPLQTLEGALNAPDLSFWGGSILGDSTGRWGTRLGRSLYSCISGLVTRHLNDCLVIRNSSPLRAINLGVFPEFIEETGKFYDEYDCNIFIKEGDPNYREIVAEASLIQRTGKPFLVSQQRFILNPELNIAENNEPLTRLRLQLVKVGYDVHDSSSTGNSPGKEINAYILCSPKTSFFQNGDDEGKIGPAQVEKLPNSIIEYHDFAQNQIVRYHSRVVQAAVKSSIELQAGQSTPSLAEALKSYCDVLKRLKLIEPLLTKERKSYIPPLSPIATPEELCKFAFDFLKGVDSTTQPLVISFITSQMKEVKGDESRRSSLNEMYKRFSAATQALVTPHSLQPKLTVAWEDTGCAFRMIDLFEFVLRKRLLGQAN